MLELLAEDGEYFPHFLEQRFSHILQRVITLWGKPALGDYLEDLLAPPPAGSKGFPQEAVLEIIAIRAIHRVRFSCRENPVSNPKIESSPIPDKPAESVEEHEAAMIFDRTHRR